jgi:hypothetical protein
MMACKPTPTDDYTPNPALASPAADAFAARCLQQLVLRGQLPQELVLPDTNHTAAPLRAHEGYDSAGK